MRLHEHLPAAEHVAAAHGLAVWACGSEQQAIQQCGINASACYVSAIRMLMHLVKHKTFDI
jgi:hypothetical protein